MRSTNDAGLDTEHGRTRCHLGDNLSASLDLQGRAPEDPAGTWKLTCVCPDGKSRDCVINVSKEGEELKATYKADGVMRAARSVAFERGILSVEVNGKFAGSRYGLTYKGRPEGDTICGDVHWTYTWASGTFAFKGERIEEEGIAAR